MLMLMLTLCWPNFDPVTLAHRFWITGPFWYADLCPRHQLTRLICSSTIVFFIHYNRPLFTLSFTSLLICLYVEDELKIFTTWTTREFGKRHIQKNVNHGRKFRRSSSWIQSSEACGLAQSFELLLPRPNFCHHCSNSRLLWSSLSPSSLIEHFKVLIQTLLVTFNHSLLILTQTIHTSNNNFINKKTQINLAHYNYVDTGPLKISYLPLHLITF